MMPRVEAALVWVSIMRELLVVTSGSKSAQELATGFTLASSSAEKRTG
jgi:hypothetical protein